MNIQAVISIKDTVLSHSTPNVLSKSTSSHARTAVQSNVKDKMNFLENMRFWTTQISN